MLNSAKFEAILGTVLISIYSDWRFGGSASPHFREGWKDKAVCRDCESYNQYISDCL